MVDSIERLYAAILAARSRDPAASRTARLHRDGMTKIAKKLVEEAAEAGLDAVQGETEGVVRESADLLYHLAVLWSACGVTPEEVWDEMARRERAFGIAEKPGKRVAAPLAATRIIPPRQRAAAQTHRASRKS